MQQKVRQVEKLFKAMDADLAKLKQVSGVNCPSGCISCCLKPDLEASVLEFLPLAWYLVTTNQHEEVLDRIESGQTICVSLNTIRTDSSFPGCRFYQQRGAICRLFGSAAIRNTKTNKLSLYSCKILKENYAETWEDINNRIGLQKKTPLVPDYYYRLMAIDPHLANDYHPINESIYKAISKVALYLSHRPKPNAPVNQAS